MLTKASGSEVSSDDHSLQALIAQKRNKWQAEKRAKRNNRIQGLWMSLFGLAVISLGFILFGDQVNKARLMIILLGFAVSVFGIYFMVTGQKMPEDPKFGDK